MKRTTAPKRNSNLLAARRFRAFAYGVLVLLAITLYFS
jgi:hypothetical protein